MQLATSKIVPCLWFDGQAEEAARFYTSVFKTGKIGHISRFTKEGFEVHGRPAGSVMTVEFEIEGMKLVGLNGGPLFKFNEAVSFQVGCETQSEIDYYWDRLRDGGGQESMCGWLKDRFGLSWQVVWTGLPRLFMSTQSKTAERAMGAMLKMRKIDIAELQRAVAA